MVLAVDQHGVGKQLIEHHGVVEDAPRVLRLLLDLGQAALGRDRAHVAVHAARSVAMLSRNSGIDAAAVGVAEVVLLEERIDDQLPVQARADRHRSCTSQPVMSQLARSALHRAEIGVDVERRVLAGLERRRHDPDQAVLLRDGETAQAVRRAIDVAERGAVGDAEQAAGEIVAPAVIGADEGALAGAARLALDRRRAVAADIEEGAQHAIGAAHHQDRLAGVVVGDEVARLAQLAREGHDNRIAPEQQPDFPVVARRIEILVDRGVAQARRVVARVGAHHAQQALEMGDLIDLPHDSPAP